MRRQPLGLLALLAAFAMIAAPATAQTLRSSGTNSPRATIDTTVTARDGSSVTSNREVVTVVDGSGNVVNPAAPVVTGTVGVIGQNGTTIHSSANPVAVDIRSYAGTATTGSDVTAVSDSLVRSAIVTGTFATAPGGSMMIAGQRDTSGSNISNGATKPIALDVKGNALMAICAKDLTSCISGATIDQSTSGTVLMPSAIYGQCDTDHLPASTTNNNFGPVEKDCDTGGIITAVLGQKSAWWAKDELLLTSATEALVKAADTTRQLCVTEYHISWNTLGAATKWELRDGASGTVKASGYIGTAAGQDAMTYTTPRCGTLNTGLYAALTPTPTTGSVSLSFGGRLMKP